MEWRNVLDINLGYKNGYYGNRWKVLYVIKRTSKYIVV